MPKPHPNQDLLIKLVSEDTKTRKEIAEIIGCSVPTVDNWRKKLGLSKQISPKSTNIIPENEWIKLFDKHKTYAEIGKITGYSSSRISTIYKKLYGNKERKNAPDKEKITKLLLDGNAINQVVEKTQVSRKIVSKIKLELESNGLLNDYNGTDYIKKLLTEGKKISEIMSLANCSEARVYSIRQKSVSELSKDDILIWELMSKGKGNKAIAESLGIDGQAVKVAVRKIIRHTNTETRNQAAFEFLLLQVKEN